MTDGRNIPIADLLAQTGWMRALARTLVADDDLAEDLVQESLLRALERPPREAKALGAWLRTVLRRLAFRARAEGRARRRREEASAHSERSDSTPQEVLERVEIHGQVVDLVLALEEPYRSAVLLRYFEAWSTERIAQKLGVDVTTVRWRIRKALQCLRERLDRLHGGRAAWCVALSPLIWIAGGTDAAAAGAASTPSIALAARSVLSGVTIMKLKSIAIAAIITLIVSLGVVLHLVWDRREATPAPSKEARAVAASIPSPPPPAEHEKAPRLSGASTEPQPAAVPSAKTAIVGLVVDRETGDPLPGAVVRVRGGTSRAVAGEDGGYRIEEGDGMLGRQLYLIAAAEGYAEEHAQARLEVGSEFLQDFQLELAIELHVTVVDAEQNPLEGVQVTAAQPNGSYDYGEEYARRTDRDGKAVLTGIGRQRKQQVNARKDGFREVWTRDYEIEPDRAQAELRIVMERRPEGDAVVVGRVTEPGGAPLPGIHVQWIHSHGEGKGRVMTETARDGTYRLVFPRDQDWCAVSAFGEGFAPSIREGVRPGNTQEPVQVDFTLKRGHWLEGEVVDEEGRPVEGASVRAMPTIYLLRNTPLYPGNAREARTDKQGRFALWDLSGPTVAIQVHGPPGVDWGNNYHPEVEVDRKVTLSLLGWGIIRGRILDRETEEPVPVFKIKLKKGAGYYDYRRADPGEVFNSSEGLFSLKKLDRGIIEFLVEAEGYIPKWVHDVSAEPEDRVSIHEVRITRGRSIEGIVVDGSSGTPIAGARVVFGAWEKGDLAWDKGAFERMVDRQDIVTGADGTFRVQEGEPGTLFVERAGYARVAMTPLEWRRTIDATGRLSVALEPGSTLSGILFEDGKPSKRGFFVLYRKKPGGGEGGREWIGNLDRDAEGRFRVEDLSGGDYLLEHWRETPGRKTAGLSIQRPVRLEAAQEQVVEFGADMGPLSFQGRLLGREGKPLDRVRLTLRPDFEWAYTELTASVAAEQDGRFHFVGLRPGKYRVEAADRAGRKESLPPLEMEADLERDLLWETGGDR